MCSPLDMILKTYMVWVGSEIASCIHVAVEQIVC
jgi:hypothetical protein